jgi:Fic family protein
VLQEMLERIVSTARHLKNPLEVSFFLWVNQAHLQPFEDGNKPVSRLAANVPLMLYNQAHRCRSSISKAKTTRRP